MDLTKYMAKPDKTIRQHTDEVLAGAEILNQLGYILDQKIYDLLKIACEYHDYGKGNPEFQKRVLSDRKIKFNEKKEVTHNVLSLYFLKQEMFEDKQDYYRVAHSILQHHHYGNVLEILWSEEKQKLIKELLKDVEKELVKIKDRDLNQYKKIREDKEAVLIKGLLHKCDYSASAGVPIEYVNNFLTAKVQGLGFQWNDLQQFCMENTNKNIIVTAQTGMGKTEAGLLWIGDKKGFFILPIRTAINAIYDRIKDNILRKENIDERLALLHSDALEYYNKNLDKDKDTEEIDRLSYYEKSRKLSMPLTISTLDQLFDFTFKYNGYELKLAVLSYSKIVIDEIQMYNADLLAYLIYGIEKIHQFGGKIAVLTATLPPFVKDLLIEALGGSQEVVCNEFIDVKNDKRHHVKVYNDMLDASLVCDKYVENEKQNRSNKILVVCNTVKKAQTVYKEIKKYFNDKDMVLDLLHNKFTKRDRSSKEKEILEFGETDYIGSGIWISTSLVEASLDIDFDYLFTELSDLNSLFQRFGRCNRKGQKSVEEENCFVFTEIENHLLYSKDNKNGFIDRDMYMLSKEAIHYINGIVDEKQKTDLISEYFTKDKIRKSAFYRDYLTAKKYIEDIPLYELELKEVKLRNIINQEIIPKPIYDANKEKIQEVLSEFIQEKNGEKDKEKMCRLKGSIQEFTVSIHAGEFYNPNTKVVKEIVLGDHEKIPVVTCHYDLEIGFEKAEEGIKGTAVML